MSGEVTPATAQVVVENLESEIVDLDAVLAEEARVLAAEDAVRIVPGSPEPPD